MTVEDKFNAAVNVIKCLPKNGPYQPSNEMMLKFYGLYKQATEGPCKLPKPSFYEVVKGYKWSAWNGLGEMHKEEAMHTYVSELKKIVETMRYTDDVAEFIDSLGPFYEFVDITKGENEDDNHNVAIEFLKRQENLKCNGKPFKVSDKSESKDFCNKGLLNSPTETNGLLSSPSKDYVHPNDDSANLSSPLLTSKNELDVDVSAESAPNNIDIVTKFLSDTDTEDEYSEPAEFIEVTNNRLKNHAIDAVTCGGGDASQAGEMRLSSIQQRKEGTGIGMASREMNEGDRLASKSTLTGAGGGGGRRHRTSGEFLTSAGNESNAQLIMILQKIHQDLKAVVDRLDILETQAYNQHAQMCSLCQRRMDSSFAEKSWWPFPELSPRSTFFLLTWPLILHGAVKFLLFLRSRRRKIAGGH